MNRKDLIQTYLHFGYLPPTQIPNWIDECITEETKGDVYDADEVIERLDLVFDQLLEQYAGDHHIVPLSGGWDSRLILGALLDRVETPSIQTVTFGSPGQLDFEIAKQIADWAEVKHHSINLNEVSFSWNLILESVKKSPFTYTPDVYFAQKSFNLINDKNVKFWSGFLGDAINGGHTSKNEKDLKQVRMDFVKKEKFSKNHRLVQSEFEPNVNIPDKTFKIPIEDAVFLGYHCTSCTTPINLPTIEWSGWNGLHENKRYGLSIFTPFVDKLWAGYWLSAPRSKKVGMKLFHEAMEKKFPELFALPSKSRLGFRKNQKISYQLRRANYGIRRRLNKLFPSFKLGPHSIHNYLDYNKAYREREDYQETLKKAFSYLEEVEATPWLNFEKMWDEHLNFKKNYGKEFNILLGLAANLSVNGNLKSENKNK